MEASGQITEVAFQNAEGGKQMGGADAYREKQAENDTRIQPSGTVGFLFGFDK